MEHILDFRVRQNPEYAPSIIGAWSVTSLLGARALEDMPHLVLQLTCVDADFLNVVEEVFKTQFNCVLDLLTTYRVHMAQEAEGSVVVHIQFSMS